LEALAVNQVKVSKLWQTGKMFSLEPKREVANRCHMRADDYLRGATSINHQVALRANFKMYSRSAKGGEKGDPNRNPWLAKMLYPIMREICDKFNLEALTVNQVKSFKALADRKDVFIETKTGSGIFAYISSITCALIFTGLSEQEGENCEGLLRDFLYYEMNIDKDIQFGNIHRFGKRPQTRDDPHRPIVARFLHYKEDLLSVYYFLLLTFSCPRSSLFYQTVFVDVLL
jgi:hypothetical protein